MTFNLHQKVRYNQSNEYIQGWIIRKFTSLIVWDAGLDEISNAVDINDREFFCSWSCDPRHTCRRSTAAAVQQSDPLGKLVLFGSPRSCMLFVGRKKCPSLHIDSDSSPWQCLTVHSTQHRRLRTNFDWEMNHPPYSPDLKPSNFHVFPALTAHLSGHCFTCNEDIKCATSTWLMQQGCTFHASRMDKRITHLQIWYYLFHTLFVQSTTLVFLLLCIWDPLRMAPQCQNM